MVINSLTAVEKKANFEKGAQELAHGVAKISSFSSPIGAEELFFSLESERGADFPSALRQVESSYRQVLFGKKLSLDTCVFCRIFLSDIENQKTALLESGLFKVLAGCAVSVIGEPCLRGGPIGMFAYHVRSNLKPVQKRVLDTGDDPWRRSVIVSGKNYAMLWNTNIDSPAPFDAYVQTEAVFKSLDDSLRENGMTLLDNSIRSWIFVRDIDNHYKSMVRSRKSFFERNSMTDKTRYLASTGIEGKSRSVHSLVSADLLSISNLKPGQIVRMEALDNMSPTITYGVTFERGLRVRFGDRSHLYISGTASIDKNGDVLFEGDVEKQTERTLDNVEALLENQGAGLGDLAYLIVYIRDLTAVEPVCDIIHKRVRPSLPVIVTHGCVCRPTWLMEIEGVAIVPDDAPYPPFL